MDYLEIHELYHHGIKGQKWGVQNGPPYPLSVEDHSEEEIKRNKKLQKAYNKIDKDYNVVRKVLRYDNIINRNEKRIAKEKSKETPREEKIKKYERILNQYYKTKSYVELQKKLEKEKLMDLTLDEIKYKYKYLTKHGNYGAIGGALLGGIEGLKFYNEFSKPFEEKKEN